jgi:hypothetical protein
MNKSLKAGIIAGLIAGVISGLFGAIMVAVGYSIGLYGIPLTPMTITVPIFIVLTVIFGTVLGLIYGRFYSLILGKGLKKGLYFGLMIWFIKDIMAASYVTFIMEQIAVGINLIVVGLYVWIVYGLVIGYLYKPSK